MAKEFNSPNFEISTVTSADTTLQMRFDFGADSDPVLVAGLTQAIKDYFDAVPNHLTINTNRYESTQTTF